MKRKQNYILALYFLAIALAAMGMGFTDNILANYFKESYQVGALARGLLEIPRELPGVLCLIITSACAFLPEAKIAMIAQLMTFLGFAVLGLITPNIFLMSIFLFIASIGMHIVLPAQDAIGLSLSEGGSVGKRMGLFHGVKNGVGALAGAIVFVGFRAGWFSFETPRNVSFLVGAAFFALAGICFFLLSRRVGTAPRKKEGVRLVFRKEYSYYYFLAFTHGIQKQIAFVYAPWILVDLMSQRADTIALITIGCSLVCLFVLPAMGGVIDRFGVRRLLLFQIIGLILIYAAYAFISGGVFLGSIAGAGASVIIVGILFLVDKVSISMELIRTVYLKQIAKDPAEVTQTLSTGMSVDHVVSISASYLNGWIWAAFGPQYVFLLAGLIMLVSLGVILFAKPAGVTPCVSSHEAL